MADTTLTVSVNADTSGLDSVTSAVNSLNQALGYTRISANDTTKPVQELFGALQSSSDKAIAGLIKGSESWGEAMAGIMQGVEIKFAQLCANMLINQIEKELTMTDATVEGNALRTASDQAANSTSIAGLAEKAISAILSDANQVFGGIFAFLAPEMGPAAAAPAAAGSAEVAALASGITYAEAGAWNIPSNTLAYLHAGEMVVPQSFASNLRDGGGFAGGGDSYTINVNAVDTQTGAQFLKNNASTIASLISAQVRNFNPNLPAWKS